MNSAETIERVPIHTDADGVVRVAGTRVTLDTPGADRNAPSMLRLAADENFNGDIVRGLLRRNPTLDIVRVQDVGLSGADDPSVLQWAADQGRIIVTHDISTLAKHAFDWVSWPPGRTP